MYDLATAEIVSVPIIFSYPFLSTANSIWSVVFVEVGVK